MQSRYYDPVICRFLNEDLVENIALVQDVHSSNLYTYCENNPINSCDDSGLISWKKVLTFFNNVAQKVKDILDYVVDSITIILGVKTDIDYKLFSKIAKEIKRSPHKVKQWYYWLADKTRPLKTKAGKIVKALGFALFITTIIATLGNRAEFLVEIVNQTLAIIADGFCWLLSWLCEKGIKLLSKTIPALGGLLGAVLGVAISHLLSAYYDSRRTSIINEFKSNVIFKNYKIHQYMLAYMKSFA